MTNPYIATIMQGNEAFGWVAKQNYTTKEAADVFFKIYKPEYVAPTRWKHTKEVAYNLSKERATGKSPKTGIGAQTNPPTSTKTAAFMGAIFAHTLRIKLGDERIRPLADEFYKDGDSKEGLFKWSKDPRDISKAGKDVAKRLQKGLERLGYRILPREQTQTGTKERKLRTIMDSISESFSVDKITSEIESSEQLKNSYTNLVDRKEAKRMVDKYGVKKIYVEEFPAAVMESFEDIGVKVPYCLREPKKCMYMAAGGLVAILVLKSIVSNILFK